MSGSPELYSADEDASDMVWVRREFSKGQIDRAGAGLVDWWYDFTIPSSRETDQLLAIASNWRSSHAFPLNAFQTALRRRVRRIDPAGLVAQRLKRFSSIMGKLRREPQMKLSQMHDLGGCRAIVASIAEVQELYAFYREEPTLFPTLSAKCFDYIRQPKADGYRGIHIAGRYAASRPNTEQWTGHRIEIQLRSRLQHAFSTAVETATTFTGMPLKFGGGSPPWRRFFSLMGSAIALREGTALVKDTPADPSELVRELKEVARFIRVRECLSRWSEALRQLPTQRGTGARWFIITLDLGAGTVRVTGFTDPTRAAKEYGVLERRSRGVDAVLVSGLDANQLRSAYPNYYSDTREFLSALDEAVA